MTVTATEVISAHPPGDATRRVVGPWEVFRRAVSFRNVSALYILIALVVLFSVWEPGTFLTTKTWQLLLDNQAVTAMVAIGLIVPLSAGVIDLAIGTEVGMGSITVAWLLSHHDLPIPLAIVLTLVVGIAIGTSISLLIVGAKIASIIATLGASSVLLAVIAWISGSEQILNLGTSFQNLATGTFAGVTYPVYILAAVALAVWYFLERTPWGRSVHATGGNVEAARLAGVRTARVIVMATASGAAISSLAGILESARLATGDPTISQSYLLPAFAAAFLGSTQFRGGRFNVLGTLLAVATLAVGVEGLALAGAPVWLPNLFNGTALLLAVGFAQLQKSATGPRSVIRRALLRTGR